MSKKRVFDIDFPDDPEIQARSPSTDAARRGPMAAAISENAEALRDRAETERAIREENDRLAHEYVRMKRDGLIMELVPLDAIRTEKLQRDRKSERDDEIDELKESIMAVGLSNPIRVEVIDNGYELIQGYRRLSAYRELYLETGEERFARIPAALVAEGDALERLYRRMVDENLVRRDISFAEMAMLAMRYASDPATSAGSVGEAVAFLFGSAGRQKRNYITHFASLMDRIGDDLRWPEQIPRALGLDLEKRMSSDGSFAGRVREKLRAVRTESGEEELQLLRDMLQELPKPRTAPAKKKARAGAKTTLRVSRPEGLVKCTASDRRVELQGETDFSAIDRRRLEKAVDAFLDAIKD